VVDHIRAVRPDCLGAGRIRDTTGSPGAPILFAASPFVGALLFLGLLRLFEARRSRETAG